VIVLGVGGYFGYGRLRHKTAQTPSTTTQGIPSGNAVTVGSGAANSSGEATKPSSPSSPPGASGGTAEVTPSSTANAPISDIRKVDFRNFEYASDCWSKMDPSFDKVMRVSNDQWTKPTSDMPGADYLFSVKSVRFGDVGPGGEQAAVVHTACGGTVNFEYNEVFVFGIAAGHPKLLTRLGPSDWGAGEEDNGGEFQVESVRTGQKHIEISFYAAGFHAQPKWIDTATFAWQGERLVRTGLTRTPYGAAQTEKSVSGTRQPGGTPEGTSNSGTTSTTKWGFGNPTSVQTNTPTTQTVTAPPNPVPSTPVPPPQPLTVQVPAGTTVEVRTIDPADSGVNHMGDILHASLSSPIAVANQVVVPQGTDVYLRVFEIHPYERSGRASEIRLVLDHFVYRGQAYSLFSSSFDVFGTGKGKAEVSGGISRGEQVHISPGVEINFQLTQPLNVTLAALGNPTR
jgi:hypothetical protein